MNEKENNVGKLSFFKKYALLRRLKADETIDPQYQAPLLDAISLKQFSKYHLKIFDHFDEDAYTTLLKPQNKEKFGFCLQKLSLCEFFAPIVLEKGSDEQILDVLEKSFPQYGYILLQKPSELFERFVMRHKSVPLNLWEQIIQNERFDLLQLFFRHVKDDLSQPLVETLFNSSFDAGKLLYIQNRSVFSELIVRLYILKTGIPELCKKMLQNNFLETSQEYVRLFSLNNPELMWVLVQRMVSNGFETNFQLPDNFASLLIQSEAWDAIKLYIEYYQLDHQAQTELFESENEELIRFYIEDCIKRKAKPFDTSAEHLFRGSLVELQNLYEENFGLPYALERKLILSKDFTKVAAHFARHELAHLNAALLMEKAPLDIASSYFLKYELPDIAIIALFKNGSDKLRKAFVDYLVQKKIRVPDVAEKHFISHCSKKRISAYFEKVAQPLNTPSGLLALFNRGNLDLLDAYFDQFGRIDASEFIRNGAEKNVALYIQHYRFTDSEEMALVERENPALLLLYFEDVELCHEAETQLLKSDFSKTHNAVVFYLEKYDLFEDNEIKLIELNKPELLKIYTEKHYLCNDAEVLLATLY